MTTAPSTREALLLPPLADRPGRLRVLLLVGFLTLVALAFALDGLPFDIEWWHQAGLLFRSSPLGPYSTGHWNYPPGFLPIAAAASRASESTGIEFDGLIKLPSVVATTALAWLVQGFLGRRGASDRDRLLAAALVVFGPIFLLITPYHGQIDALAILPAVVALVVWDARTRHRALVAGLLIGAGICIKAPPGFLALALLGSARDLRERLELVVATAALPVLATLPFLVRIPDATVDGLTTNRGIPGWGGLTALLQPALTRYWLSLEDPPAVSALVRHLYENQNLIVLVAGVLTAALLVRRHTEPLTAAVTMFLVVIAVNPNWAFNYLVWGMPFFLMTGRLRAVGAYQVVATVTALPLYTHRYPGASFWPYLVFVTVLWLVLVSEAARYLATESRQSTGPQPPLPGMMR